ncbi:hypothetical protein BUALT_Bualt10G0110100 [Buddleja alternifolia]|uniref:DDT domain-containing protein DDR4 n=1 Tax=Buddleja alternifolia TaxID=168488 RepID=A0AAV6WYY1_9LAMI|nr:hypothetical protein BUALT_Bualt10G0110100 [Buddleja alternifolia]
MAEARRRPAAMCENAANDDVIIVPESSPPPPTDIESHRKKLRQRWELASVLNFLHVFEPVIRSDLKMSAEEIETALIEPDSTLAQLHVALLKGITSKTKTPKSSDAWMMTLSRTLAPWWPWFGEGDFPLFGSKGVEISMYKELDPTTRLLILKALCELRADEKDALDFINKAIKNGTDVSAFRKVKLAGDGDGIAFWYDGSEIIGHRLYKEVLFFENEQLKRKGTMPAINSQWETKATNLDEFNQLVTEFSSSEVKWEVALSKYVEADIIPVLEKQWKKKQRALQRQQREQMLLNGFRNSGITRSCRNQKPINYRFGMRIYFYDYDRAITEAIQYTKSAQYHTLLFSIIGYIFLHAFIFVCFSKRKSNEERGEEDKQSQHGKRRIINSNESHNSESNSSDDESTESDAERNSHQSSDDTDDDDAEYDEENEDDRNEARDRNQENILLVHRPRGSRFSKRLAGIPGHTVSESLNIGAKKKLTQRDSVNTAAESLVVLDSEDEKSHAETS